MMTHGRGLTTTRRNLLLGASAAVLAPPPRPSRASFQIAQGTVRDEGCGRGIPGILVSNGRDVVASDGDGRWTLPVMPGDFVFVIKPSGWKVLGSTGEAGGRWYYLHEPLGTPDNFASRFAGVMPTGALQASIDFVLARVNEPTIFNVALVADTQPGNALELRYVQDSLLAPVADCRVAFAIHHGDVMGDDLSMLPSYLKLISACLWSGLARRLATLRSEAVCRCTTCWPLGPLARYARRSGVLS